MTSDAGGDAALTRIAEALERLAPPPAPAPDLDAASVFVWRPDPEFAQRDHLRPVTRPARIPIDLLLGVDRAKATLLENTRRFAAGLPANNALLWGARGMGKSSLVKAAQAAVNRERAEAAPGEPSVLLIEILREDLPSLDRLLALLQVAHVQQEVAPAAGPARRRGVQAVAARGYVREDVLALCVAARLVEARDAVGAPVDPQVDP